MSCFLSHMRKGAKMKELKVVIKGFADLLNRLPINKQQKVCLLGSLLRRGRFDRFEESKEACLAGHALRFVDSLSGDSGSREELREVVQELAHKVCELWKTTQSLAEYHAIMKIVQDGVEYSIS